MRLPRKRDKEMKKEQVRMCRVFIDLTPQFLYCLRQEGEEGADWPYSHPGCLLEGFGWGYEKSYSSKG
jgi:hypothetical protein